MRLASLQLRKHYLPRSALASHVMVKKKDVCHKKQNIICRSWLVNAGQPTIAALHDPPKRSRIMDAHVVTSRKRSQNAYINDEANVDVERDFDADYNGGGKRGYHD